MPTRLITIPFALGQDEETAPRELPLGPLREAVNVRQRRGKAFGVRADYTAALMTEFDGTWTPLALYALNGRLFSLGNRQTLVAGVQAPTDIAEYVQQPGGAWKGTLAVAQTGTRVPPITKLRNVGQVPDGVLNVQAARIAAFNGLVCMAYGFGQTTPGATSYVHIFRANTDSTILFAPIAAANARVVVAGNSFWVLGVDASSDLAGFRFDTTTDDALRTPVTLYTGTVTNAIFDAVSVARAAGILQFATFVRDGATTVIRRFNEAGTQQTTFAGPAVAADVVAMSADSDVNQIMAATRTGVADAFLSTYNLTTNALLAGPTAMFGETVSGSLSLMHLPPNGGVGDLFTEDATARVLRARFITANHAGNTVTPVHNYTMGGQGAPSSLGALLPVMSGDFSNQILVYDLQNDTVINAGAQADEHIANPLIGAVGKGGQIARDSITGLFYWSRIVEGTDTQTIPLIAEITVGSTARRQAAQIGNLLFVTGAVGLSFDARQVVEAGFLERPVFVSTTPSVTGGDLLPGAEYDYVAVFKWTDGQGRLAQSQVSEIQTVTMGVSDNGVTAIVYAPHTMRRDANNGSVPTVSLYRTDSVRTAETAAVFGSASIDSPSAPLVGLTLRTIDGVGGLNVVTFTGAATNAAQILSEINAVISPDLVATKEGGVLKLETVVDGPTATVLVQRVGTANAILGFSTSADTVANGSEVFTKGSIFQLAATQPIPVAAEYGAPATLVDNKSDADLLLSEVLYTQGEFGSLTGILEHEAPPSSEFCAAVGSRIFLGGMADRTEVAISKALAPAEGMAFSSNFSFRANVDGNVTAVASLDGVPIAFTADSIYTFNSQLPDDQGKDGELGPPIRVPSEGGCNNADSIIETSLGLFYQSADTKLMLLPRGRGASPQWIGKLVQDSLVLFPRVTGVAFVDEDNCIAFTCQDTAGTASTILVFDLRIGQWYRDTFASAQVIKSPVEYLGRLAYIDNVTVRLQSASLTPAAFIPYNAKTGSLALFGDAEWGKFVSVTAEGENRGTCQLRVRISYDDGVTFTNLKTFVLTGASGTNVVCQWWPNIRKGSTYVLDFQVLTNGSATEGVVLNHYTIEVEQAAPVKRRRTSTAERG